MTTVRMVGVDPGAHVGLIAVDVVDKQISGSHYIAAATMHASQSEKLSHAERDANLFERLTAFFSVAAPAVVVYEEPFDASLAWRGHTRQQRGTAARLGTYYGLCVAAARTGYSGARLISYPVTNIRDRKGWMQGKPRSTVLSHALAAAKTIHAPNDLLELKPVTAEPVHDHVLMALGVLVFHLSLWHRVDPLALRRP